MSCVYARADIAKSIIAPSITMNGLFTTFFPVIGFFYVAEIDGKRKEGEAEIKEQVEDYIENYFEASREDDLKIFNHTLELTHTFWENLRNGFLKYIATCIIVSVLSLLSLLLLYVFLSPAQFILFDIPLLSTIAIGILPIIQVAMIKTPSQI